LVTGQDSWKIATTATSFVSAWIDGCAMVPPLRHCLIDRIVLHALIALVHAYLAYISL